MNEARIFLSYARKHGEAFATALRQRLQREHPELPLWQDRAEMEGGVGWWIQIEEALDRVEFLVIVMTPRALASEITRKEWRYARQRGVIVYPVKGVPDAELDFDSVPNWMRKAQWFDIGWLATDGTLATGPEWETFIRHLQSHHERRCVPFMAPDNRRRSWTDRGSSRHCSGCCWTRSARIPSGSPLPSRAPAVMARRRWPRPCATKPGCRQRDRNRPPPPRQAIQGPPGARPVRGRRSIHAIRKHRLREVS